MIIKGKYNNAVIYTTVIEDDAKKQIKDMCNSSVFKDSVIRIMPDVHSGAGCTIGTTMTIKDKVVPNMVGVDIGCGMEVIELKDAKIDYKTLDEFIHANIPAGMNHRKTKHEYVKYVNIDKLACAKKVNIDKGYLSLGTLGGGNHFIEVDEDDNGALYLVIHTGSRHLGLEVAEFYQKQAPLYHKTGYKNALALIEEYKKQGRQQEIQQKLDEVKKWAKNASASKTDDVFLNQYLEGELLNDYLNDMRIMQEFAFYNRKAIADDIIKGLNLTVATRFTTIHNYIDLDAMILRKGAVSAKKGEKLLIPLNMRDGSLICIGKGNKAWNCSAPHGAGRLMSRTKAVKTLSLNEYKKQMKGIYSTTVCLETIDEAPMAYKRLEDIVDNIATTVTVKKRIRPTYNFKSAEQTKDAWRKRKK